MNIRRACLVDGEISERAKTPGTPPEIPAVSRLCAELRSARGVGSWPLDTAALLDACLETNDPAGWSCLKDDICTGDAGDFQSTPDCPARLLNCLFRPKDSLHAALVFYCAAWLVPKMAAEAVAVFADGLAESMGRIPKVLAGLTAGIPVRRRDAFAAAVSEVMRPLPLRHANAALRNAPELVEYLYKCGGGQQLSEDTVEGLVALALKDPRKRYKVLYATRSETLAQEVVRDYLRQEIRTLELACDILGEDYCMAAALARALLRASGGDLCPAKIQSSDGRP